MQFIMHFNAIAGGDPQWISG